MGEEEEGGGAGRADAQFDEAASRSGQKPVSVRVVMMAHMIVMVEGGWFG